MPFAVLDTMQEHVWGRPGPNCQGQEAGEEDGNVASFEVWPAQTSASINAIAEETIPATEVSTAAVYSSSDSPSPSVLPFYRIACLNTFTCSVQFQIVSKYFSVGLKN